MTCDRCGWRAYLVAVKGNRQLTFCFHHGNELSVPLEQDGWRLEWDINGLDAITPGHRVPA